MRQATITEEPYSGKCLSGKRHGPWKETGEGFNGASHGMRIERCQRCGRERKRIYGRNGNSVACYVKGTGKDQPQ